MMSATYLRSARGLSAIARRTLTTTARRLEEKAVAPATSTESPAPKKHTQLPAELPQAPNRKEIWSRSQRPRSEAMTGPRFEQTDFELQVRSFCVALPLVLFVPSLSHACFSGRDVLFLWWRGAGSVNVWRDA